MLQENKQNHDFCQQYLLVFMFGVMRAQDCLGMIFAHPFFNL